MNKNLFALLLCMVISQMLFAQTIDTTTYSHLVKAGKDEFLSYARSVGLTTEIDTVSQSLFAKTKGCLYVKPLGNQNNNEYYDLVLIVSTQNKENNKLILRNTKENPDKKGFWTDDQYLYREWDMENPASKEMWYKVLVYKKKK